MTGLMVALENLMSRKHLKFLKIMKLIKQKKK